MALVNVRMALLAASVLSLSACALPGPMAQGEHPERPAVVAPASLGTSQFSVASVPTYSIVNSSPGRVTISWSNVDVSQSIWGTSKPTHIAFRMKSAPSGAYFYSSPTLVPLSQTTVVNGKSSGSIQYPYILNKTGGYTFVSTVAVQISDGSWWHANQSSDIIVNVTSI